MTAHPTPSNQNAHIAQLRAVLALAASTAAMLAVGMAMLPARADALIRKAVTLDGPSSDIVGFGGAAMAPDGTGGLVYLKREQGEPHVFVSRFLDGTWQQPQRVDTSLPFDSSWPQIGAGLDGRLVVIWAQSYARDVNNVPFRRMYSATIKPGSPAFGAPIVFDQNLASANATGDEATSQLYPSLAMNASGKAYLVYRVLTNACTNGCGGAAVGTVYRPGDSFAAFRLARFNGETWSVLGDINRNPAFSVRPGARENSPQVTIDAKGNGVVAFQEPDNSGFDRIWARRLFGATIGQILPVSLTAALGRPVNGDADAFDLAGGSTGGATAVYRQQTAPGSLLSTPRVLDSSLPQPGAAGAGQFAVANVIDSGGTAPGAPGVGLTDTGSFSAAFAEGGAMRLALGDPVTVGTAQAVGPAGDLNPPGETAGPNDGDSVTAWASTDALGQPVAVVQERIAGRSAFGQVAAAGGGPISNLSLSGSHLGDALVAFQQGQGGAAQIAAALIQAPPEPFLAYSPPGWVQPRTATITWDPALQTLGTVTYSVGVDGLVRARGLRGTRYRFDTRGLASGRYHVVVLASDDAGQQTLSNQVRVLVDRDPPRVSLVQRGRRVSIRITDGPSSRGSGVDPGQTRVSFGDRTSGTRLKHTFRRRGGFSIRVRAQDIAGNAVVFRIRVRIR